MPTEFLVDVIIVCAVVLSLLGIALLILKWR